MAETKEDFWGCVLSKEAKEVAWEAGDESEDDISHKLQITQACLGPKAKDNERNLVQVTTEDENGEDVSFCILSLRLKQNEQCAVELGFTTKATFKLLEGNGPVHLTGCHLQALAYDAMDSEESGDEEEASMEAFQPKGKSLPKPAKGKKVIEEEDSDDEDEEMNDSNPKSLLDDEASEDDEDEDEEEDDDDDDDDEDDEDEDDDEDEEEEEEEEVAPPSKKKKLPNGTAATPSKEQKPENKRKGSKAMTNGKSTPAPSEEKPAEKKGKTPKTPTAPKGIEEIKKTLGKSPNLPKTLDKFKNFMRSAHRVTDEKEVKGVWEWLQKNKK